ncbi:hypothetical protein [Niallia sp. NCCP-28]|uniref:hypothetical protein n=1 Tax=Niallia sp. NCCP-28 TaxID=2934712 RepID=UPI00207F0277|nr:hypothetical protein [Niallia sp. NCCP-28]GKU82619.1 hypothetical protein NCCP28_20150 [Niallia sp. NCCP-28]
MFFGKMEEEKLSIPICEGGAKWKHNETIKNGWIHKVTEDFTSFSELEKPNKWSKRSVRISVILRY